MKKAIDLLALVVIVISISWTGCVAPTPAPNQLPTPAPNQPPVIEIKSECIDFESSQQFNLGDEYGNRAGHKSGEVIFYIKPIEYDNAITVSVHDYFEPGGSQVSFSTAEITGGISNVPWTPLPPDTFSRDQHIHTEGVNLRFDFSVLDPKPSQITFEYLHEGGGVNLDINGGDDTGWKPSEERHYERFSSAPDSIGGVKLTVAEQEHVVVRQNEPDTPGAVSGVVTLDGAVETLVVGGAELAIDRVCWLSPSIVFALSMVPSNSHICPNGEEAIEVTNAVCHESATGSCTEYLCTNPETNERFLLDLPDGQPNPVCTRDSAQTESCSNDINNPEKFLPSLEQLVETMPVLYPEEYLNAQFLEIEPPQQVKSVPKIVGITPLTSFDLYKCPNGDPPKKTTTQVCHDPVKYSCMAYQCIDPITREYVLLKGPPNPVCTLASPLFPEPCSNNIETPERFAPSLEQLVETMPMLYPKEYLDVSLPAPGE